MTTNAVWMPELFEDQIVNLMQSDPALMADVRHVGTMDGVELTKEQIPKWTNAAPFVLIAFNDEEYTDVNANGTVQRVTAELAVYVGARNVSRERGAANDARVIIRRIKRLLRGQVLRNDAISGFVTLQRITLVIEQQGLIVFQMEFSMRGIPDANPTTEES